MTTIIDFYSGDKLTQKSAKKLVTETFDYYDAIGRSAHIFNLEDYKMIHVDDLIKSCQNVEDALIVKQAFDSLECSLFINEI